MKRNYVYVFPQKSKNISPSCTLEEAIKYAEKQGEETFKIKTEDGFTVFDRFYRHNTDGTKEIISNILIKEDELTPKEAVEAMLNGERLRDYKNSPDEASYRWDGSNFVKFDGYYHDSDEIISSFTGLHRNLKNQKST